MFYFSRLFFDQLGTILLMAVVGTIFNMFTIGGFLYLVGTTGLFRTESEAVCHQSFLEIGGNANASVFAPPLGCTAHLERQTVQHPPLS